MAKYCSICGNKGSLFNPCTALANNKFICISCFEKTGEKFKGGKQAFELARTPVEEIEARIRHKHNNVEEKNNFVPTRRIGKYIEVDESNEKLLLYCNINKNKNMATIFNYSDIISCELLEEENLEFSATTRDKSAFRDFGLKSSLIGKNTRITAGQSSQICNGLRIKITTNSLQNPTVYIAFIENKSIPKSSDAYRELFSYAQECLALLNIISNRSATPKPSMVNSFSNADEIKKYKQLLEEGIITDEEFQAKKTAA